MASSNNDDANLVMNCVIEETSDQEGRQRSLDVVSSSGDVTDFREVSSQNNTDGPQQKSSSRNLFAVRQNFVRQLCDASLLAANASQLRVVLEGSPAENVLFWPLTVMIGLSILLHIGFGFLMIQRWRKEREAEMEHERNRRCDPGAPNASVLPKQAKGTLCFCSPCLSVEKYDEISMCIMLLLVGLNVVIAGLGLPGPR